MRFIIIFLFSFVFSTILKAEYNGYQIKFEMETVTGNKIIGYVYTSKSIESDSINNTNYLKNVLDRTWEGDGDSLHYYKERIKYKYKRVSVNQGKKYSIYGLNNMQVISKHEIKSIEILETINQSFMVGISSPLSISDTTWINKEPLKSYSFGAYLCFHQIYIHVTSQKIENILSKLQSKQIEVDETDFGQKMGDKLDDEFHEIIAELIRLDEKVVVLTECSC